MSKARKPAPPPPARKPASAATTATIALAIALVVALVGLAVWAAGSSTPPPAPPPVATSTPSPVEQRPAPRTTEVARPKKPPAPETERAPEPEEEPEEETASTPAPEFATAWARGQTEVVRVKRVVDGDTLELSDGRKVRLVGINTPERDKPLYTEASAALKELADGAEVTLEFDQERLDQYKRMLAYVFKGELFVNGELVRRGLAYCYTWEPNVAHRDEFVTFQRQARAARRGLWGMTPPAPESVYVADGRGHRFHRGSCARVKRISSRLEFKTREDAFDAGQNPCDECLP